MALIRHLGRCISASSLPRPDPKAIDGCLCERVLVREGISLAAEAWKPSVAFVYTPAVYHHTHDTLYPWIDV